MNKGIFGCPQIIQVDNGTEFLNEIVSEVIKITGTNMGSILAYSKEENAIVERCNKEVMRHIKQWSLKSTSGMLGAYFYP
jgi:hypothetical protein